MMNRFIISLLRLRGENIMLSSALGDGGTLKKEFQFVQYFITFIFVLLYKLCFVYCNNIWTCESNKNSIYLHFFTPPLQ